MDSRSEANLVGVHPDLVKVIRAADQTQSPFVIIHGRRTLAEETACVARGASTTMRSRHLPNKAGFACAVDYGIFAHGIYVASGPLYTEAWEAIEAAAKAFDVSVEWGGNWRTFKDLGHVQLPWAAYP